jgi:YVTN family beta-propeller protein
MSNGNGIFRHGSPNFLGSTVRARPNCYPDAVTVDPGGSYTYVTNYGSNTVSIIRLSTNMVGKTVGVGAEPDGVAVTIRP